MDQRTASTRDVERAQVRVLVTILAYRSSTTVEACVRSALALEHPGPVVVAVREQGNDPSELALLRQLSAEPRDVNRELAVSAGANLGFAGGHNLLLAAHRGDVVLVLNADATVAPDLMVACLAELADPAVGAVQPRVTRPAQASGRAVLDTTGLELRTTRRVVSRDAGRPVDDGANTPGDVFGVDGCVALYRRQALDDAARLAGGQTFWPLLFAYKEDVELAWRLQWAGWRTRYQPAARAVHVRAAPDDVTARGLRALRVRRAMPAVALVRGFANQRLVQLAHEDVGHLRRNPWPFLRRELAAWLVLLVFGPRRAATLRLLARGIPAALRRRRQVRLGRRPGADPYAWAASATAPR